MYTQSEIPEDFIVQLEQATIDMTELSTTEALQDYLTKFIKRSAIFMQSKGLNEFLNRLALSLQFGALTVDALDTFAPAKWVEEHSCYQADGSRDFSKDLPKIIFLSTLITYGVLDYALTRKVGAQKMSEFRQVELPAITAAGVCIFLENLKPNLGFDSRWTIREAQGIILADFVREMVMHFKQPNAETMNIPEIAAPLGTLKLSASALRVGILSRATAEIFANVFVLALMAKDPSNFHDILNYILVGGIITGAATSLNDKLNNFVGTYISPVTSNMSLSVLALMSLIDCWVSLSPVDNPVKWLAIAVSVYAAVGALTAVLTESNAKNQSRSPAFFSANARGEPSTETPNEESHLQPPRGQSQ